MSNDSKKSENPAGLKLVTPVPASEPLTLPEQVVASAENPLTPNPVAISPVSTVTDQIPNPNPAVTESYSGHPVGGYPIILNGDHAEFEAEWAGKDPKTRPDWPLPSFDANDWAESFTTIMKGKLMIKKDDAIDTMRGWFANALMRGFDEASARASKEFDAAMTAIKSQVADEKKNIKSNLERELERVRAEALEKGKGVWLKYGGVFVAGIAVGLVFTEYFK